VAPRVMNRSGDERSLACLIERSAELKRALVGFALSSRMERHLERFVSESAGPNEALTADEAIDAIDRFALLYRFPNGKTVLDQFLAGWPDLSTADREMLRGWRDPVDGIFEICGKDGDSLILLNLIDDLEYRAYSNMGPAAFRPLPKHGFVYARLVPIGSVPDAWLVSGSMRSYRKSDAAQVAQAALELATRLPELVRRNHRNVEEAWQQMRAERAAFVDFCGGDELVLPPAEAEERINAFYRQRQEAALDGRGGRRPPNIPGVDVPAFQLPPELADADTIGVIYDEIDGLNFYNEYGILQDLFADPALASDKRYADVLRGYLRAETIGPLPLRRLAAAHLQTVDVVFRKILRQPHFTWAEHGEALLRRWKPWYFEHEPRPNRTVIGARLSELISR
jgi:hypothetical protein